MRYYLQDEYDASCGSSCQQPVAETSKTTKPQRNKVKQPSPTRGKRNSLGSPPKEAGEPRGSKAERRSLQSKNEDETRLSEQRPVRRSGYGEPREPVQRTQQPILERESPVRMQKQGVLQAPPPVAYCERRRSSNRDVLNEQFPSPYLVPDVRKYSQQDQWDEQFYRWWGWQWLKENENKLREQMAREGKRFSREFPIYMAKVFTQEEERRRRMEQDQYPEKLIKEEVYETQQAPYVVAATRPPDGKQEKRWSLMKTINNALKSKGSKDRKSTEVAICRCGENLNICGPYNKQCRGMEGFVLPCGLECDCMGDRKCMDSYMKTLCPCDPPCRCPKESTTTAPPPLCSIPEYEMRGSKESRQAREARQSREPREHYGSRPPPPRYDKGYSTDETCSCAAINTSTTQESVEIPPHKHKVSEGDDCCCSCDEELCECCCCCCLDISKKGIQTSRFCLRENCTQTDKTPKRCCRCCRCCNSKGKQKCSKCIKKSDSEDQDECGAPNGKVNRDVIPKSPSCCAHRRTPNTTTTTYTETNRQRYHPGERTRRTTFAPSSKRTMMVRTNSIQCMPVQENKSTTFNYEDTIPETVYDRFLSQLHGLNKELNRTSRQEGDVKYSGDSKQQPSIKLNIEDIAAITKAKLRNYFLEGDVYSSPVTGRNYDLSYRAVDVPAKVTSTKIFKPLNVDEQLQGPKLPPHSSSSDNEQAKLMTAICEAILSNNRNADIEEPTKDTKENNTVKVSNYTGGFNPLAMQAQLEMLHTINEDNESIHSGKNANTTDNACSIKPSNRDESQAVDMNQQLIFEIQQNFKDKINKLEEKIAKLMQCNDANADPRGRVRERSRSKSPQPQSTPNIHNKNVIADYRPFMTKTGLVGGLPRRSQMCNEYVLRAASPNRASTATNQHGDVKSEDLPKQDDDSIAKYESLVTDNQKHVDELLGKLQILHSCNAMLDKCKEVEGKKDTCCLETQKETIYKPDLGTGENFTLDKIETLQKSTNKLLHQLENLFTGDAQAEQIFCLNEVQYDDLGPSTSTSMRETGILNHHHNTDDQPQQIPLDFSSIVFKKYPSEHNGEQEARKEVTNEETVRSASYPNFILKNLQSYTTSISDIYTVQKILRREEVNHRSSSSFSREDSSSDSSLKPSDLNVTHVNS